MTALARASRRSEDRNDPVPVGSLRRPLQKLRCQRGQTARAGAWSSVPGSWWALAALAAVVLCAVHEPLVAQAGAWSGGFFVAVLGFRERGGRPEDAGRFVGGLALAAGCAWLGWRLIFLDRLGGPGLDWLAPAGFCVLFAPMGIILVAGRSRGLSGSFANAALGSLPLALAAARVGCIAAGCCYGIETPGGRVPTALLEICGYLLLDGWTRGRRRRLAAPAALAGIGLLRLAIQPLRAVTPPGPPLVPPELLAAIWVGLGAALHARIFEWPRRRVLP